MEKSLVPVVYNELCITNVEFQGCFIKIWANSYSKKQENLEKNLQNYTSYSKVFYCYIIILVCSCIVYNSDSQTYSHHDTIFITHYNLLHTFNKHCLLVNNKFFSSKNNPYDTSLFINHLVHFKEKLKKYFLSLK